MRSLALPAPLVADLGAPDSYNTAYFEIPSLRVYTNGNVTNNEGTSAAASGSAASSGGAAASRTSAAAGGAATARPTSGSQKLVAGAMGAVGVAAGWALM